MSRAFTDIVFSWSLDDIFNQSFYSNQVEQIPDTFESVPHYFGSYNFPLLEETRAELASSLETIQGAPFAEVTSISESRRKGPLVYHINVDNWRNRFSERDKEPYQTFPGDVFIISDSKPETVSDLKQVGWTWTFALVTEIENVKIDNEYLVNAKEMDNEARVENDISATRFKVKPAKDIDVQEGRQKSFFVVFLMNITTANRIWKALHMIGNMNIIDQVISPDYEVEDNLQACCLESKSQLIEEVGTNLLSELNVSQSEAIMATLSKMKCNHKSTLDLIWGPPGTGKTKTISVLLFVLLKMNCRTLVCAPTNVAVNEVALGVLKLVKKSFEEEYEKDSLFCSLGDILLFGNKKRLKVNSVTEDIYLDYRVDELTDCFGPQGWKHCLITMIDFLEDCPSQYEVYVENEMMKKREDNEQDKVYKKQKEKSNEQDKVHKKQKEKHNEQDKIHKKQKEQNNQDEAAKVELKSFVEFVRERFQTTVAILRRCLFILCTHLPTGYLLKGDLQDMKSLIIYVDCLEKLLFSDTVVPQELKKLFSSKVGTKSDYSETLSDTLSLAYGRTKCISVLRKLRRSLQYLKFPYYQDRYAIMDFCYQNASLILCTASSSFKLYSVPMEPPKLLVIDEAAQLKECESSIPLQLQGLRHAILVGDECQLPAMVFSKVSSEVGFGRSLFERLSMLGHPKHLLNVQYRMHPSISFFPNSNFYSNRIQDAPLVQNRCYQKKYLDGQMFGPYSFINVIGGKEEMDDDGHSRKNMVEVALVVKMIHNLYKAWDRSRKLSIGVISPYAAQVVAIQDEIGHKYEGIERLTVKIKSVDGFQGGENDVIIISTVRSNSNGSIGFLSSPQRTNVALTRARHCLWILGNERTLLRSESIWEALVIDVKNRGFFFNADQDKDMAKVIIHVKEELGQLNDLLNQNSLLFRKAIWKVLFSDNFIKSFAKVGPLQKKKAIINLLLKLSSGWRPKKKSVDYDFENSLQIWKQFKVGSLFVLCTIDIKKESSYIQVLKVWDLLPSEEIPKLVKRLEGIFATYSDIYIKHCKMKCLQGNLEIPMTWVTSDNIVQFKDLVTDELGNEPKECAQRRIYVENSRVSESLKLMKFYSLSCGMVKHLLSERGGEQLDLPFEVTDEQCEMILVSISTFIIGRSGTGKTTILVMKLFRNEQFHFIASKEISAEGFASSERNDVSESNVETKESGLVAEINKRPLRQLFVTVSPKLCYAVKQHVSGLKRFACDQNFSEGNLLIDMDDISLFEDLPDSFIGIARNNYPLVITFHKFLMMLDGTVGNSFFERFTGELEFLGCKTTSSRSVALETFLRTKEVTYDRFCSFYWGHFNSQLKKKLDSSRVFTEIISHIKGGLKDGKVCEGKLSREDYVLLSDGKVSTLTAQTREKIYDIFIDYENLKMVRCEFDLSDLVNDLHHRLKRANFEGDEMDYVYIDEVQDLTMRQIALFKYICRNVDEGFVFAGDTAQTIARGIDFRFQDIRSLFYNEFLMESRVKKCDGKKDKMHMSEILCLKENFRTHDGVLKLAQSVIDLLYHFFRHFIDILDPEISHICGEDPILLESGDDENAIVTIFGKRGCETASENLVGFGAEQVILVRDDCARKEISSYVGKQALVLTIVECKGLEFQDVLLYNFFGSSPLKNQWRVIYGYMDDREMLADHCKSYPSFDHSRHNLLCSELKQLYVAITRTRQRLWICENVEDLSKPMFDYWKKKSFVQVKKLDESLAQAMQVASSPEEWKARGIKLFHEDNYEMATMCFERAGDVTWEKWAKAAGMKSRADRMRDLDPEGARLGLLQAAEIFYSIGKAESAAACFYESGEFEKAGRIYLDQCGENKLNKAGECFDRASRYDIAADVYAKGRYFSECLLVCSKGKLFERGLQYIRGWKQLDQNDYFISHGGEVLGEIEQSFLESCANHYFELEDNKSMMKFVKVFCTIDSIRNFLKKLNCFDELLLVEEELGNFTEALKIAQSKGNVLLEAELLGKAGQFREASLLMLWYVVANSLWLSNNKGWPPKEFPDEEQILYKAKSLAIKVSDTFFEFVSTEVDILKHEETDLSHLICHLKSAWINKSLRGEVLCIRRVLDIHLHKNVLKYEWEYELLQDDIQKQCEKRLSGNCVTIGTLTYFWGLFKEKIENIFRYMTLFETEDDNECVQYRDFCLNYLGVRRQKDGVNINYLLMNPDASWVRDINEGFLRRDGTLVFVNIQQSLNALRNHFQLELLNVGLKLLNTLQALHNLSVKESMPSFCQSTPVMHIFEVAKYLLRSSKDSEIKHQDNRKLENFLIMSAVYFEHAFPLNCQKSLELSMICLRRSDLSCRVLEEVILANMRFNGDVTYGQIGRVVMILLGSGKLSEDLYARILKKFEHDFLWYDFLKKIGDSGLPGDSSSFGYSIFKLFRALGDTYNASWRVKDYISPHCFFYLVDRLFLWASFTQEIFFTTKSSFVEEIISGYSNFKGLTSCGAGYEFVKIDIFNFVGMIIEQVLFDKVGTTEWIKNSYINLVKYYPLFLLKVVLILCLLCVNHGQHCNLLYRMFGRADITSYLPRDFIDVLRRKRGRNYNVTASTLAEAFQNSGNPLIVVSLKGNQPKFSYGEAIFVDMNAVSCKEDALRILFPIKDIIVPQGQDVEGEDTNLCNDNVQPSLDPSSNLASIAGLKINCEPENQSHQGINLVPREEILSAWNSLISEDATGSIHLACRALELKEKVDNTKNLIVSAMTSALGENEAEVIVGDTILDELLQLSSALDVSEHEGTIFDRVAVISNLLTRLKLRRPSLETLLDQLSMHVEAHADNTACKTNSSGIDRNQCTTEEASNFCKGTASKYKGGCGAKSSGKIVDSKNKGKGKTKSKGANKKKGGKRK